MTKIAHGEDKAHSVAPPPTHIAASEHNRILRTIAIGVAIVLLATIGGGAGTWMVLRMHGNQMTGPIATDDGNALQSQSEQDISQVASRVAPSVVSISTNTSSSRGQVVGQGAGTGVIVSKDGYVLTNGHVVKNATTVDVTTSSGVIYSDVKIIGSDPLNDIAFLKIKEPKDLQPATLGDSSTLKIGQNVFAIGNSLGEFNNTVTSGIVSGLNRPVAASSEDGSQAESLSGLIQTDAAINPGNSGGPLVNRTGQVIGINTAVASDAQGIGFAIPINSTKGVLASVLATGKVERAYIGVRYVDITPLIARQQKLSVSEGALVSGDGNSSAVIADGPAAKAGIKDGDIITKIEQYVVGGNAGITSIIGAYRPGDTVTVTYLRGGKEHTTKLTLAKYEETAQVGGSVQEDTQSNNGSTFDPRSLFGF